MYCHVFFVCLDFFEDMAAQLKLKEYVYRKGVSPKTQGKDTNSQPCEKIDMCLERDGVAPVVDIVIDTRDTEVQGHAGPASTAVRAGDQANFGPGWSPDIMFNMMQQQQQMLAAMTSLMPKQGAASTTVLSASESTPPPAKRARETNTPEQRSDGELSDQEDSGVDRAFEDFVGEEESEGEPDLYADISAFFVEEEELAKPVSEPTAKLVNSALRTSISHVREKELAAKVLRPANCEGLVVPKVNVEVWREIRKEAREEDGAMQKIQGLLHKGLGPLVAVMDTLRERKEKVLVGQLGEAFRLLALASTRLTQKRREQLAPELDPAIRAICLPSRPVTSQLFGDDLPKALREIREGRQVSTKITTGNTGNPNLGARARPSYRQSSQSSQHGRQDYRQAKPRGRGAFLGRRGGQSQRRKGGRFRGNDPSHRPQ